MSGRALLLGQKPIEMLSLHSFHRKKGYHIEYQKYYIPFHIWKSSENTEKSPIFFAFFGVLEYNIKRFIIINNQIMTNIEQLKKKTDEIKKWLEELKNNVSLSEADKKNKAEELKAQAETTKQKIENEIHSLESKTDDESKKKKEEAETLLNTFNETMTLYASILNSAETKTDQNKPETKEQGDTKEEKWFFWKAWEWIWEQWSDVLSGDKRKEKKRKNVLRVVWFWVTWYAVVKWIKKLWDWAFWDKEKKKDDGEGSKDKEWFWDTWYWKALKRTGIWTWIYYVSQWLITWDWSIFWWNPFSKEKKDGVSTIPWSDIESSEKAYEKLSQEDKQIYESSANAINEYQWNIMWDQKWSSMVEDLMWDSEFDKDKIWLVPFMLSNRYDSLNKMLSETSFYYEILGTEWHIARDKLKDFWLDGLKKLLTPLVWAVNWLTFDLLNLNDGLDSLIEKLKWVEWLEWILRTVFRKSITVMSYYQSRKWALESKLAEQELLKSDPDFSKLSDEEKIEEISDHLQDEEWYKQHIQSEVSEFMKLNLKNATKYLQEKWLLNGELDPSVSLAMDKVEERRKDLLDIDDEDDTSVLEDMKPELQNWKLSDKYQKKLENVCNEFEEEMEWFGRKSRWNNRLPILEMFDLNEDTLNKILSTWWYDDVISVYKKDLNNIREKSKNGTLTESDLESLEHSINDYYKFQKSLLSQSINLSESRDENWNVILRWGDKIYHSGEETVREIKVLIKWDIWDKMKAWGKIVWWLISLDLLTYPIRLATQWLHWRLAKSPTLKILWKGVVKPSAKLGAFAVERVTWNAMRANLWWVVPARFYTEDTLRIAIARWDITLDRAVKVANKNGFKVWNVPNSPTVKNKVDLMKRMFNLPDAEARRLANVVEKFWDNPNIYKKVMKWYYDWTRSSRRKPTDRFRLDRSKKLFEIDIDALTKLENIAVRVDNMTEWVEKKVMQSMMRYIKDIDQAEYIATMWVGDDMVKLLEWWEFMKPEKYWKYLAKYAGKIDADDMRAFEKFIIEAKKAWKIWNNNWLFIRNAMKNFAKIKEKWFAIDKIDDLALNTSRWSKMAESTKAGCDKMVTSLKKMVNNPKFKPFHPNIKEQIEAIGEFKKTITPEWMKAMKDMSIFDKESAFSKLNQKWVSELSKLRDLLRTGDKAKELTKALKWAKTLDEVKAVLRNYWIAVDEINDGVLLKIANTWSAQKLKDIVNYGAEFKSIQWVKKLMSNPAIKQVWRIWWKALIWLDFLFVWYNFYAWYDEAQRIKQSNLERWERKEWQAYFELWTWWLWAVAGACMFIPWAWWVAWWVLAASMAAMEIWNKYYEDIEKFKQNQADFLAKWIAATKQELTSIDSWEQWLSRTWVDNMSMFDSYWSLIVSPLAYWLWQLWASSVENKKAGVPKTKSEALKALIKMEELQKNPLAWADLNDPDVVKNPELVEAIRLAKQQVEEIVQKRFDYFKINYLDKNKPIIEKSKFENDQAISAIESSLEMSSIYAVMDGDANYTWEKSPEKYKEEKLQKLKKWNEWNFKKLEKIMEENPTLLFQMDAELPYYRSILSQYWWEDQEKLSDTCDYFEQYMVYKLLWKPVTAYPSVDVNPDDIDYNQIHNFMSDFTISPTVLDENESKNYKWLSDEEILEKYGISGILWQDVLFECAKLLNYNGKNSLDDLKLFFHESKKEVNGIYYDGSDWVINENNGSDDEFAKDAELNSIANIEKMREYVNDNVNGSFIHWSMFTENTSINKEIRNKMKKIIDEYLSLRKWNTNSWIESYVKDNSKGKYITLPIDLVIKWRKAWLKWVWSYLYKYENWKLVKRKSK